MAIHAPFGFYAPAAADGPIETNLVLNLDAGDTNSYPGTGTDWINVAPGATNDWTLTNSPTHTSGDSGYFNFDGSTQYAGGPGSTTVITFGTGKKYAWEFICRPAATTAYMVLQAFWEGSGFTGQIWWIGHSGATNTGLHHALRYYDTSTSQFLNYASGLFAANTWVHFVINMDFGASPNATFDVFKNGDTTATYSTTAAIGGLNSDGANNAEPDVGRQSQGSNYWNGDIAVVRVYDEYNLTAADITQNYNYFKDTRGYSI